MTRPRCLLRNPDTGWECSKPWAHASNWHRDRTGASWWQPLNQPKENVQNGQVTSASVDAP